MGNPDKRSYPSPKHLDAEANYPGVKKITLKKINENNFLVNLDFGKKENQHIRDNINSGSSRALGFVINRTDAKNWKQVRDGLKRIKADVNSHALHEQLAASNVPALQAAAVKYALKRRNFKLLYKLSKAKDPSVQIIANKALLVYLSSSDK